METIQQTINWFKAEDYSPASTGYFLVLREGVTPEMAVAFYDKDARAFFPSVVLNKPVLAWADIDTEGVKDGLSED